MTQHGLDQDFHRMNIHDPRKQLSPPVAKKPTSAVYRSGPAPFRGYHDNKEEFPPPPPPTSYMDHNFPPPPPESKENIYHEIQDDDFPPPPPTGEYRGPDSMQVRTSGGYGGSPLSSYESRHESQTIVQPSGRYEREVKQATYSVQSSDSSGRSSPYGGQYANLSGTYSSSSVSQNYSSGNNYGSYASKPGNASPVQRYSSNSPRTSEGGSGVVYADIADTGVTYAQIAPRSERPTPGPQVPVQVRISDSGSSAYLSPTRSQPPPPRSSPGQQYSPSVSQNYATSPSQQYSTTAGQQYSTTAGPQYSMTAGQQYSTSAGPQYSTTVGQQYSPPTQQYQPAATQQYATSASQPYESTPSQYSTSSMLTKPAPQSGDKEKEVDALTQMLMQGLEGTKDPEFYGICAKCGKKVLGETNGCTAMDQIFHIQCFVCVGCGAQLRGKSFYAMERKPYCETCYVNTLERCSVCSKPITDRLLRATGKPYHPACFTCVVCGKSLDGIPFTVDATNQIHCIEDFHKKFAPRCCVCHHPIMPAKGQEETVRVVAMDRSFHVECYRCEDCNLRLSSEAEGRGCYPLDDHILCKNCNAKRINALTTKLSTEL